MTFEEHRRRALSCLAATRIWRSNYAPPIYRIMVWMGLKVRPPHFNPFMINLALNGVYFGIVFGAVMTVVGIFLEHEILPTFAAAALFFMSSGLAAGLPFGLLMASYYRLGSLKSKLPTWDALAQD